jgi:hypothetical protein
LDEVKRKVFVDLFASPGSVVPVVVGLTSLMYSWAVGGDPMANAVGIVGVLGGLGYFASRLTLGLETITRRAYESILQQHRDEQNRALDELERRLTADDDPRTEMSLRQLRSLYDTFQQSCQGGKLNATHHQLVTQVEDIFHASVRQLKRSLQLHHLGGTLTGRARDQLIDERERVIREVLETRDHLSSAIEQFQTFALRRNNSELGRLREELDETLRVAKRTEERIAKIGREDKPYDESEFE